MTAAWAPAASPIVRNITFARALSVFNQTSGRFICITPTAFANNLASTYGESGSGQVRRRSLPVGRCRRERMGVMQKHLLLFAATTGYQIRVFADAARRVGAQVSLATDRCHVMEDPWLDRAIAVKFDRIAESLEALRAMNLRVGGVAAVGDKPAVLAAEAARMFGVPFHSPAAARACHDKRLAKELFQQAGMQVPQFFCAASEADAGRAPYPCVLKPVGQSASKGVIRANNETEFAAAWRRIARMGESGIQVEAY